ncbi:MAG: hypothetical protein ACYCSS_02560 [Sulfuriferula sp.]
MQNKLEIAPETGKKATKNSILKHTQDELKNLKHKLNLSDEAMANAVGVTITKMIVMLYGTPKKIPAKVLNKIKVLEALSEAQTQTRLSARAGDVVARNTKLASKASPLREDQQELIALQKALGLTHDDLAQIAGIPRSRMMTYVYGRTKAIPEKVLLAIRNLRDSKQVGEHPYLVEAVEELEGSLPDFIAKWQKRLGIDPEDDIEIAKAMGISKSTLVRWCEGTSGTRPSFLRKCLSSLHAYEKNKTANKPDSEKN